MPNVTWQSMPPNLGAVNLPVQNDSLSSSIFPFIIIFLCYGLCYDSYKLGQDQLCSIKFKEALFKDTVVLTRLDQKHVGYGSRERERAGECLDRGERLGLTAILPPTPNPISGCARFGVSSASGLCTPEAGVTTGGAGAVLVLYARRDSRPGSTSRTTGPERWSSQSGRGRGDLARLSVKLHCSSNEVVRPSNIRVIFSVYILFSSRKDIRSIVIREDQPT